MQLIKWDVYEISTRETEIHGVMLRGRIRKLGLSHGLNVLCENASDVENCVRFAVPASQDPAIIIDYLNDIIPDVRIALVVGGLPNPVLSKLKVNNEERYELLAK